MIVFYEKQTGRIIGHIAGRVHDITHLDMWMGDRDTTDRVIIEWRNRKPDHEQTELLMALDRNPGQLYRHKIDPETRRFIPL